MTPLMSSNMKIDPTGRHISGTEFVVTTTSQEKKNQIRNAEKAYQVAMKTAGGKLWIKNLQGAAFGVGLGMFVAYLILARNPLWNTNFIKFYFAGIMVFFAVSCIMSMMNQRFRKDAHLTAEVQEKRAELLALIEAAKAEQGVNVPTEIADVFCFAYEHKETGNNEREIDLLWCRNPDMSFYTDEEFLYICNIESRYALPKKDFLRIRKVNERKNLVYWNKAFSHKGDRAKEMGIKIRDGALTVDCYYVLELQGRDRIWGLCFPPYELGFFERLSNLKAEE